MGFPVYCRASDDENPLHALEYVQTIYRCCLFPIKTYENFIRNNYVILLSA